MKNFIELESIGLNLPSSSSAGTTAKALGEEGVAYVRNF